MFDDQREHTIRDYLAATIDRDVDLVGTFLTEDCVVWLPPSAQRHGLPRPLEGRDTFLGLVRAMLVSAEHWSPRSITPYRFFSNGDTTAVHLRLVGDMPNGAVYDNDYVFLYTFRQDQICEIREFTDTAFIEAFVAANRRT